MHYLVIGGGGDFRISSGAGKYRNALSWQCRKKLRNCLTRSIVLVLYRCFHLLVDAEKQSNLFCTNFRKYKEMFNFDKLILVWSYSNNEAESGNLHSVPNLFSNMSLQIYISCKSHTSFMNSFSNFRLAKHTISNK